MPNTHCLPSGSLGTSEISVSNLSSANISTMTPAGAKRGVFVFIHGISVGSVPIPMGFDDTAIYKAGTFATALAADGWICLQVALPEVLQPGLPTQAIYNDVNADTGHGSRHLATKLHWWDHIVKYIRATYNPLMPIVPFGISWGGWHTMNIIANRPTDCIAYIAHVSVVKLSGIASSITTPVDFTGLNSTGLDSSAHILDSTTIPGMIGWHTSDTVIDYTLIQTIYNNANSAGMPVSSRTEAANHSFDAADATAFESWVTSTVDPLAPASF